jgi:isopenicillin N synthase-like dioxygenase
MTYQSDIPVLDVSAAVRGDSQGIDDTERETSEACRGISFFCVTGHRIDPAVMRHTFEMSRNLGHEQVS